jgi:beta-galactosidase
MNIIRVPFGTALIMGMLCSLGTSSRSSYPQASPQSAARPLRTTLDFDADWRFLKGDSTTAAIPQFDDSSWRRLKVPHDWSVEGPLSAEYGSGNGYAPGRIDSLSVTSLILCKKNHAATAF